jgi:hypothetical protein
MMERNQHALKSFAEALTGDKDLLILLEQDLPDALRAQPEAATDVRQRLALLAQLADLPGAIDSNR